MAVQKEKLWQMIIEKKPHWLTDNVTLTPKGLKKLFETTFEHGHSLGLKNGKLLATSKDKKKYSNDNFGSDFLDKIMNR